VPSRSRRPTRPSPSAPRRRCGPERQPGRRCPAAHGRRPDGAGPGVHARRLGRGVADRAAPLPDPVPDPGPGGRSGRPRRRRRHLRARGRPRRTGRRAGTRPVGPGAAVSRALPHAYHEVAGVGVCINGRQFLGNTPTVVAGPDSR
jgi:hypothetical protein